MYTVANQSFRVACLRLDVFSYTHIHFLTGTLSFGCHGNSLHIVRVFVCSILTHGSWYFQLSLMGTLYCMYIRSTIVNVKCIKWITHNIICSHTSVTSQCQIELLNG